ncbi:unnamed protein product [Sphenostylis stenocarpa]|uniref:Uncharacterized protein n=1 Tax=Sphenostylis stenocarpa TaxID=92480 RepID=A0AA86W1S9_9FABA|nr:unnamed protein product [Sphenostylis stenocarpa]
MIVAFRKSWTPSPSLIKEFPTIGCHPENTKCIGERAEKEVNTLSFDGESDQTGHEEVESAGRQVPLLVLVQHVWLPLHRN